MAQGQSVTLNQGGIGAVIAERAQVQDAFVGLMAAREVKGEARILFDVRAAVVFGLVVGVVTGLLNVFLGRRR